MKTNHFSLLGLVFCLLFPGTELKAAGGYEALCTRVHGEPQPGKRCFCPISKSFVDPLATGCFQEENCIEGHGKPTKDGCLCVLDSRKSGRPERTSSRAKGSASCVEDKACVTEAYGVPTERGCVCQQTGQLVDPKLGQKCDLQLKVDVDACKSLSPKLATREIREGLAELFALAQKAQTGGCQVEWEKVFSPEELATVKYFAALQQVPKTWPEMFALLLQNSKFRDPESEYRIPDLDLIQGWHDLQINEKGITNNIEKIRPVPYRCPKGDGLLYPAYPEQKSKIYSHFVSGRYSLDKIRQKYKQKAGEADSCKQTGPKMPGMVGSTCLRETEYRMVLASDTFLDACGNLYRGFWHHGFLLKDESMGDLFSRGRSETKDPLVKMPNSYVTVTGSTWGVPLDNFFLLSEPFPGDTEKSFASRGRSFNSGEFLFACGKFAPREL